MFTTRLNQRFLIRMETLIYSYSIFDYLSYFIKINNLIRLNQFNFLFYQKLDYFIKNL